jgi:hypothetical protein
MKCREFQHFRESSDVASQLLYSGPKGKRHESNTLSHIP